MGQHRGHMELLMCHEAPGRSLSKAALRCGDESYDDSDLQHLSNGVASLLRVFECKVIAAHMEESCFHPGFCFELV